MDKPSIQRRQRFLQVTLIACAFGLLVAAFAFDANREAGVDASAMAEFEWSAAPAPPAGADEADAAEVAAQETAMLENTGPQAN